MNEFKLGRLPKEEDPRTFQFAKYAVALPPAPVKSDWGAITQPWGMLGNDAVGCCTISGAAHAIMLWHWWVMRTKASMTAARVLKDYSAITGYVPGKPETAQGASMLAVLRWWRHYGIVGHTIVASVEVDPKNVEQVKAAIAFFGCLYVGVDLPDDALPRGAVLPWNKLTMPPNERNGHCVIFDRYDAQKLGAVTWGTEIDVTWAFAQKYVVEAYACLAPDWRLHCPAGFNAAQLDADLQAL